MTSRTSASCQHELRPGTMVCLHCRRAEREARATRQREILVRVGLTGAAIGACVFAGLAGYRALTGQTGADLTRLVAAPASLEAAPLPTLTGTAAAPAPAVTQPARSGTDSLARPESALAGTSGQPAAVPAPIHAAPAAAGPAEPVAGPAIPVTPPSSPVPPLEPLVAEGRTELQNGIYALRRGDTVTVHFDTPEARTRRPEKFEQIVRATLPAVHGAAAQSILSGIATGNLLGPGDAITEPQPSAIALRGGDGTTLSVMPQTRPGRDGPLVVAYRVIPTR